MTEVAAESPEIVDPDEHARIANIVRLTIEQLRRRFAGGTMRRGVHPKDHGCVKASFTVNDPLPEHLRVGLFATPGRRYDALIRFSNADVDPDRPDSPVRDGAIGHGGRGMAIKVLGVCGTPIAATNLATTNGPLAQDFLLINQPVFAFANIVDYEVLSEILLAENDEIAKFFARTADTDEAIKSRALRTGQIITRIGSPTFPPAFQDPPRTPLDNRYFSAAAFLFGPGRAAKFAATPTSPAVAASDFGAPGYLRAGLRSRLAAAGQDIAFDFQVQIRGVDALQGKLATEIEDVCTEWPEGDGVGQFPFETVARIAIQTPQDIDVPDRMALCEDLVFTPWSGLADHRPLGGINRLRRAVYEASARMRHVPRTCPFEFRQTSV